MSLATTPVTITSEAAARVAELGMQAELECMLEHTRQTVPGLHSVEVQLAAPSDIGDEIALVIEVTREHPPLDHDPTDSDWGRWKVMTFPPDVCRHFVMMSVCDTNNAA